MSHLAQHEEWLKELMLKIIVNLGSNVNEARYELCRRNDYIMSNVYFVDVKFKDKKREEVSVILKRPTSDNVKLFYRVDHQFYNEIRFYQMYVRPSDNLPRCFYADDQLPVGSVIALENVNKHGYYSCPYTHDVPLEYTLAAFRELGRFHAKGYVMKELQREKFFDIVRQIKEIRYDTTFGFKKIINLTATRSVEYLRKHGHDEAFCDKMEAVLSNVFDKVMMKTAEPREPLSTLCHGDFTSYNVLFKAENDGQYRAMLIDFALVRYSTPVIDLSTYLYLCGTKETREDRFSEVMQAYYDALKEYLLEAGISDMEKYSYDAFLNDYKKGALFGFVIASLWLGPVNGYGDPQELTSMEFLKVEENMQKKFKEVGGDKISKILADMLLDLKNHDCLKYYFE
ncbi:hypothetical protein PUN28_008020 [Cardiocondyla obscurior]|uniref:CHK kinase-like domain-containing protein n=1 Tax=Cardiocondyla obscurior TaxID=286306 RepID=A0AAW2FX74_9HYME